MSPEEEVMLSFIGFIINDIDVNAWFERDELGDYVYNAYFKEIFDRDPSTQYEKAAKALLLKHLGEQPPETLNEWQVLELWRYNTFNLEQAIATQKQISNFVKLQRDNGIEPSAFHKLALKLFEERINPPYRTR